MKLLKRLQTLPLQQAMRLYESKLKQAYVMEHFQIDDWITACNETKAVFVRSRGGSKTKDFVNWIIFETLRTQQQWIWLSCKSGQLNQALLYVRQNPFVKHVKNMSGKYDVMLWNGMIIRFGIISTSNLGLRVDGIVYDEFEDLQSKQEYEVYPQMAGMLTHSIHHKTIYLGTLWIAALLNDYALLYPTSIRPWDTIPWLVKSGMIQDEIDAKITPKWEIDLMYNCIPTAPHGVCFPNVVYEDLSDITIPSQLYGMDFGSTDHCVGIVKAKDKQLYILDEYEFSLEHNNAAFDFLQGQMVEAEAGGYNDQDKYSAKRKMMQSRIGARGKYVTPKWKSERVMAARRYTIHIDINRTPGIGKDIKKSVFGPDGLYLKNKTSHPCHWLDAFLHAIGANSDRYLEGPYKGGSNSILKREALREQFMNN